MHMQYKLHANLHVPMVLKLATTDLAEIKTLMHLKLKFHVLSCCLSQGADLQSVLSFTLLNEHRL